MKPVLVSAGNVKRDRIQKIREKSEMSVDEVAENLPEQEILVQSVCETMVPKVVVAEDIPLLFSQSFRSPTWPVCLGLQS